MGREGEGWEGEGRGGERRGGEGRGEDKTGEQKRKVMGISSGSYTKCMVTYPQIPDRIGI